MQILITGTSKGVGAGLAKKYLAEGHEVFGISRSANKELENFDNFHFLALDLSDFNRQTEELPSFISSTKSIDLVVLNAGMLSNISDMRDTSIREIKEVMDINVWSNKVLLDVLFEQLAEVEQIVAISSGASVSGARGWNAYSLSKATLNMLINLYAKERPETHFCALAPGLIDTGMQDYIYSIPEQEKFPVLKKLKAAKGTEKMPTPDKAAGPIAHAIQKAKNYESGSFLDIRDM